MTIFFTNRLLLHSAGQEPRTDSPEGMDEDQGPRTVIWGTNLNIESVQKEFEDFFSLFKENETDEEPFYQTRMRVVCILYIS